MEPTNRLNLQPMTDDDKAGIAMKNWPKKDKPDGLQKTASLLECPPHEVPKNGNSSKKKSSRDGDKRESEENASSANNTSGVDVTDVPSTPLITQKISASSNTRSRQYPQTNQRARKQITIFKTYLSDDEIHLGLQSGSLLKGAIRINQRKYEEAFINNPVGSDQADIAILGMPDRNRALHGDIVAVSLRPRVFWVVNEEIYKEWKEEAKLREEVSNAKESSEVEEVLRRIVAIVCDLESTSVTPNVPVASQIKMDGVRVTTQHGLIYDTEQVPIASQTKTNKVIGTTQSDDSLDSKQIPTTEATVRVAVMPTLVNKAKDKSEKKKAYRILSDLPLEEWGLPDSCLQKTAEVVGIIEKKNSRLATGKLELATSTQRQWAKFSPSDSRIPRMMIPAAQLPNEFFDRPQDFAKFLFVAKISEWSENSIMALGSLEKQLGLAGDIHVETEGLLITNEVDTREFSDEVLACLPVLHETSWQIDKVELARRRDLRDDIIFTIDPKAARDLDDALSVNACNDVDGFGLPGWEVGVHIADVSYFVRENTVLDEWALARANSVYLVHEVVPMLPRLLCEELCSLNAGVDRLTFSVIFKMDEKGNVYDEWFGRSVIRSRVKLTYEHAQDFIENPEKEFSDSEMPQISDGVTVHQIKAKVLQLHTLAKVLRLKRSQCGSLQLDQPKLKFALDDETKMPIGVSIYQAKDSNWLVEEFMLLANMAVARKIERHYRKTALLRMHPPPKLKVLREALNLCSSIGFPINGTSSQQLSSALAPFHSNVQLLRSINQVLSLILMKAMELARYFCTGSVESQSSYYHYALNVPFYTHFTSPIRRYPDIIVHRLLAASLSYCEPSTRTVEEIQKIAEHCNDKKLIAKKVSEASAETFFGVLVQRVGSMDAKGVVVNVLDASFDVLLFKYGIIKRVYVNALETSKEAVFQEDPNRLVLYWDTEKGKFEQLIQMCTVVDVVLSGLSEPTKFQAVIKPKSMKESPTLTSMWQERTNSGGNFSDFDALLLD